GEYTVGDIGGDAGGALAQERFGSIAERAARIDDIVDEEAIPAGHVANDVHHFRFPGAFAAFVDDCQRTINALGEGSSANHAANVRRDHHDVLDVVVILDVAGQDRNGVEVVSRDVEEALDLAGMQVKGENPVGAGFGDQIGDELGGDWCAGAGLAVLPGIAEIGKNRGDAFGGRTPE